MSCPLHFFAVNLIINLLKIVNEVGIQVKEEMNDGITALLGEKSLHWHVITIILFNAKIGIFPPSYAVMPSFISSLTTFIAWIPASF